MTIECIYMSVLNILLKGGSSVDIVRKELILSYLNDYKVSVRDDMSHYRKLTDKHGGLNDYIVRQIEYLTAKQVVCTSLISDIENDNIGDLSEYVRMKSSLHKGSCDFYWDVYQILKFL